MQLRHTKWRSWEALQRVEWGLVDTCEITDSLVNARKSCPQVSDFVSVVP